jgi:hypothetical protein
MKSINPQKKLETFYDRDWVSAIDAIMSGFKKENFENAIRDHLKSQNIESSDDIIQKIVLAVSCYVLYTREDLQNIISLSDKVTRKNLQIVTRQAKNLINHLQSLDQRTKLVLAKEYEKTAKQDISCCLTVLDNLIKGSELGGQHITESDLNKTGRHGDMARNGLVYALAQIYEEATGKKPPMPHLYDTNETGKKRKYGGTFWKFAAPFFKQEEGEGLYKIMLRCLTKVDYKPVLKFFNKHPQN